MSRIKLLAGESPLESLANEIYANRHRARDVWLISPWIGGKYGKIDPIATMSSALSDRRCRMTVITRQPTQTYHAEALNILQRDLNPDVYYCRTLHAKLYYLGCDGFTYAMLGSANLTARAQARNKEIGVEFRTSMQTRADDVARTVDGLLNYARDLLTEDDVQILDSEV